MIKILVADHHPVVTKGIEYLSLSNSKIHIIGFANSEKTIFTFLKDFTVDVIVLDINLPNVNGFSIINQILEIDSKTKVIIFSDLVESVYASTALNAGAFAFIHKSKPLEDLKNTILSTKYDEYQMEPSTANTPTKRSSKLSLRESQVLTLIQEGLRNKEIAEKLNINEKTVSTYKIRLMKKLNVTSLVELINLLR